MLPWLYLVIAIAGEWIGTSALKATKGFTIPLPSVIVVVGYCVTFYFLSLALRSIPYGIAYAVWCGLGIVLVTVTAYFLYGQKLDLPALIGVALIMAGVFIVNVFSHASAG
jgi:small multidrug resistance pump